MSTKIWIVFCLCILYSVVFIVIVCLCNFVRTENWKKGRECKTIWKWGNYSGSFACTQTLDVIFILFIYSFYNIVVVGKFSLIHSVQDYYSAIMDDRCVFTLTDNNTIL